MHFSIAQDFDYNVSNWVVGTVVDCTALSVAMEGLGGFPSRIYVREEMKKTWSILVPGIIERKKKWAIVGSPGVGKSILTVLICCHLAKDFNRSVFLARKLKGEEDNPTGEAGVFMYPGGKAVGHRGPLDFRKIYTSNYDSYSESRRLVVLDGWAQSELKTGDVASLFGGFDLLATSTQYIPKGQDNHYLVALPSWNDGDLKELWKVFGREVDDAAFDLQLYYSGGSARELGRPIEELKDRINIAVASVPAITCAALLAGYGGSQGTGFDGLRRCFLTNQDIESYTVTDKWEYTVCSAYALKRLSGKAPFSVYLQSLTIAKNCGQSLYGSMFEALVHQLFQTPNIAVTLHVRPLFAAPSDEFDRISLGKTFSCNCSGKNKSKADEHWSSWVMGMDRASYWQPDYPEFPTIDSVVCLPKEKTIIYLQVTVGKTHGLDFEILTQIHGLVKMSLIDSTTWKFKYIAAGSTPTEAHNLKLTTEKRRNIQLEEVEAFRNSTGVDILTGYVEYQIE